MAEKLGMGDLAQSNGFGKQTPKRKGKAMLKGEHLCLSDLLDQDLSSYEYFQALPSDIKRKVMECDFRSLSEIDVYKRQALYGALLVLHLLFLLDLLKRAKVSFKSGKGASR